MGDADVLLKAAPQPTAGLVATNGPAEPGGNWAAPYRVPTQIRRFLGTASALVRVTPLKASDDDRTLSVSGPVGLSS